jgi:tetratricopeptide (TPR) repeat protein
VFQHRYLAPPQPHVRAAQRWIEYTQNDPTLRDPAECLMAVWHARTALARKPDDPAAFRILVDSYRLLMLHESAMLEGRTLTPANFAQITLQPRVLSTRFSQRTTSLNFAIQTSPPPKSAAARDALRALNLELGQLYLSVEMFDLARDRFQAAIDLSDPAEISPAFRTQMSQILEQTNQVQTRMKSLPEAAQADPVQRARLALGMGATGLAIEELYNAEQSAVRQNVVRPLLVDLYCETGQPDKALDLLGNTEDPSLNTGPGTAARRQGLVNFLLGNAEYASSLWQDRAIAQIRGSQASQALVSGQQFLKGDVRNAVDGFLELPNRVSTEANWEFDLALCLLESGEPARAAEHFTNALKLRPNLPTRPVIVYYLEKLGQPAPPIPTEVASPSGTVTPRSADIPLPETPGKLP